MTTTIVHSRIKVEDVMTREPICVDGATTIRELARLLEENEISGVPVVGSDGKLIGVVSKTDLIRRCAEGVPDEPPGYLFELLSDEAGEDVGVMPEPLIVVEDFMTTDPVTARAGEPIERVGKTMAELRIHRIIVVDRENRPVGIVTSLDALRAMTG